MRAGIVDYRMGNLASVSKALEKVGAESFVSGDPDALAGSDLVVLPGVGNFAAGMANLQSAGLDGFVREWAAAGKPLLGICMGMQLFFEHSEEGDTKGLGILPGRVVRLQGGSGGVAALRGHGSPAPEAAIPPKKGGSGGVAALRGHGSPAPEAAIPPKKGHVKVPHMGWNTLRDTVGFLRAFEERYFYFVHSYACVPSAGAVAARTTYDETFASAVASGSVVGVQFHPEKSSHDGLALLTGALRTLTG